MDKQHDGAVQCGAVQKRISQGQLEIVNACVGTKGTPSRTITVKEEETDARWR